MAPEAEKLIRKSGSVIGYTSETVVERKSLNKLFSIMDSTGHPLQHLVP